MSTHKRMHLETSSLNSQLNSVLESLIQGRTEAEQAAIVQQLLQTSNPTTERDRDVQRKRAKVTEAARLVVGECKDQARREACLQDPERFLKTYFASKYRRPFGRHHYQMIETIVSRAKHGGRQAIAAPRGCGKSEVVKGMLVYLVLAGLVRFPMPIASTTPLAGKLYADFRHKIATNDLLRDDFPEVCDSIRDLEGAPLRAHKQHVDGEKTHVVWKATELSLPHVPGSPYGGVKMVYYGLDAAFRGVNIDGVRPDFVLVDDPETRESAKSYSQCEDRERILDQDVAGLAGEDENLAVVVLTTIQNRTCLSYKLTDRSPKTGKPAWNGLRYGMIQKWPKTVEDPTDPTQLGLWTQYIALRHKDQAAGDEHGLNAVAFYLENRKEMDEGAEMLTDHFTPTLLDDGTQVTHSTLQVAFNKIADTDLNAYRTEYQNDPPEIDEFLQPKLSAFFTSESERDQERFVVDDDTGWVVRGVDVRKIELHHATIGMGEVLLHQIPDYGVQSHGTTETTVEMAESLILEGLHRLADKWDAEPIVNTKNEPVATTLTLIDKGWLGNWKEDGETKTWASQPVETFCMERSGAHRQWLPAKGQPNYKPPKPGRNVIIGDNWHLNIAKGRQRASTELIWSAEHWHTLVEDLFKTDDTSQRFALFAAPSHGLYAHHRKLAEHIKEGSEDLAELRRKASKTKKPKFRRDHWWDALAMALVAKSVEIKLREMEGQWAQKRKGRKKVAPLAC